MKQWGRSMHPTRYAGLANAFPCHKWLVDTASTIVYGKLPVVWLFCLP